MYPQLYPGDIFAVKGKGLLGWACRNLIKPSTDRVHFGMIGDYIPWDDDYVILESIGKGIAVGRLSFYDSKDIEIYRRTLPNWKELGKRAAAELTEAGRGKYDYLLILDLLIQSLGKLLTEWHLPPYDYDSFEYTYNDAFICTEAAAEGWRLAGFPLFPPYVVPMPAAFKQSLIDGNIEQIFPEVES